MINNKIIIIGPCSLESKQQLDQVCQVALNIGTPYIRAQIYKPRTNPNSFQGLGVEGLHILEELQEKYQDAFSFVMEACSVEQLETIAPYASIIQIGARNMQNFELLKSIGKVFDDEQHDYVLLKRGFSNTVAEWVDAAEYIIQSGVPKERILLCERGTRTFTSPTGVHLDFLCALEAQAHGFNVVIDPSHGTKDRKYVLPMAQASLALNFDGVMIECHPEPDKSVSDAKQAISLEACEDFFKRLFN